MEVNGLKNSSFVELLGKDLVNTRGGGVSFLFVAWEIGWVNSHLQELS